MLGVSYVVCQAQITAVVQAALNVPDHGLNARGVRALGPRFNDDYSRVEVLWALANYFKHRDSQDMDKPERAGQTDRARNQSGGSKIRLNRKFANRRGSSRERQLFRCGNVPSGHLPLVRRCTRAHSLGHTDGLAIKALWRSR